eukprot:gene11348-23755_t
MGTGESEILRLIESFPLRLRKVQGSMYISPDTIKIKQTYDTGDHGPFLNLSGNDSMSLRISDSPATIDNFISNFVFEHFASAVRVVETILSKRVFAKNTTIDDLNGIMRRINRELNRKFPEDNHIDRCKWESTREARGTFLNENFFLDEKGLSIVGNHPVLVHSLCLGYDSLGNQLGQYMENRICANISGIHYISVSRRWKPRGPEDAFMTALPSTVLHPDPKPYSAMITLDSTCPCNDMCHEYENGLVHIHLDQVRSIFLTALESYMNTVSVPEKTFLVSSTSASATVVGKAHANLPMVPDVAIHYRCGDNTVGHYGFLPFRAFKKLVPAGARLIYVMCEHIHRYNPNRPDQKPRCELVLKHLHIYLSAAFPSATVLLLRGQDVFLDLYRLTHAKTTICSVSTFCLWPAIASRHSAYFPVTRLVAKATRPYYGPHFKWITDPPIFHGVKALGVSHEQLVKILSKDNIHAI